MSFCTRRLFFAGCLVLFAGYTGFSAEDCPSGPALEISGPEIVLNEKSAPETGEKLSPEDVSENLNISALLAEERQRAASFLSRLKIDDSFVARLAVKLPIVLEEVKKSVAQAHDRVARKIKELEPPASEMEHLPLSDLTADEGLMKRARVSFDDKTDTWVAVWKKPAMFHFGMILHPELLEQVKDGEKLYFESKGMKLALLRSDDNKLMVEQSNGQRHELGAKRLEALLRRSITVDGLELFLDHGGNLILKAAGQQARLLAQRLGTS